MRQRGKWDYLWGTYLRGSERCQQKPRDERWMAKPPADHPMGCSTGREPTTEQGHIVDLSREEERGLIPYSLSGLAKLDRVSQTRTLGSCGRGGNRLSTLKIRGLLSIGGFAEAGRPMR